MIIFEYVFSITASIVLSFPFLLLVSKRVRSFVQNIISSKLNRYTDERIDKFEKKVRIDIGEVNGKIEVIQGRIDSIQDKLNDLE